jgi:hypothetical protein
MTDVQYPLMQYAAEDFFQILCFGVQYQFIIHFVFEVFAGKIGFIIKNIALPVQ